MQQRSDAWYSARIGKLTASRFADILGGAEARKRYACEIMQEIVTGEPSRTESTPAMQHGIEMEPYAVAHYEQETGTVTHECSFFVHERHPFVGASPDRLIGFDGLLEVKCPYYTYNHVYAIHFGAYEKHKAQVQGQLWITEREWCDLVSFDPRFTEQPLHIEHVVRDDEYIEALERSLLNFWYCIDTRNLSRLNTVRSKRKTTS